MLVKGRERNRGKGKTVESFEEKKVMIQFVLSFILYFLNYCPSTVVSIFLPPLSPVPPTPTSHPQSYPPLALSMGPSYMFIDDPCPSYVFFYRYAI